MNIENSTGKSYGISARNVNMSHEAGETKAGKEVKEDITIKDSFTADTGRNASAEDHHHNVSEKFDPDDHVSDFVKNTKDPVKTEFNFEKSIYKKESPPKTITILHTNDLHGNLDPNKGKGGMAYVAGKIEELAKKSPDRILIDAGDIAYSPPFSKRNRFSPMPEIMNKIGYDVSAAGNHEFQYEAPHHGGPVGNPNPHLTDNLKELQEDTNFPIICANVLRQGTYERPDYVKPFIIQKVGDINVGVVGIVTKKMATKANPDVAQGWKVIEPEKILPPMITQMKEQGAEMIVVVSHDNLGNNKKTISRIQGIDLMIGGHDHQSTDVPIGVTDPDGRTVPLVEAGAYGYMVGELKFDYNPDSKKISKITSILYPVRTDNTKPDKEINDIVDKWINK